MNLSTDQINIRDYRGGNLLVSAAAGSGKTTVMVQRVIKELLDAARMDPKEQTGIDRMLIVTFTRAAAANMRGKITDALNEELNNCKDEKVRSYLQKQLTLLHSAYICTLDSFAVDIVRNHFSVIGTDPDFRIVSNDELRLLEEDTLTEVLEEKYGAEDEMLRDLVDMFSKGHTDDKLRELILKLAKAADSAPWPEEWLRNCDSAYHVSSAEQLREEEWIRDLTERLKRQIVPLESAAERFTRACEDEGEDFANYAKTGRQDMEFFHNLLQCGDPDSLSERIRLESLPKLGSVRVDKDDQDKKEIQEGLKKIRDKYKENWNKIKKEYSALSVDVIYRQLQQMLPYAEGMIRLTMDYMDRLQEKKMTRKTFGFSDISHYALRILYDVQPGGEPQLSETALEFRRHFDEVITDEYQDTNMMQEALLNAISGQNNKGDGYNRFMVGDVKQSIYGFRLARPDLFLQKYEDYRRTDDASGKCMILSENYRSRKQVIDSVNDVFEMVMTREIGGIEYDASQRLNAAQKYPKEDSDDYVTEIILVTPEGDEKEAILTEGTVYEEDTDDAFFEEMSTEELQGRALEAAAIAEKIGELMSSGMEVYDKNLKGMRPLSYGDIAILFRSTKGWSDYLDKMLSEKGIRVRNVEGAGYYNTMEIRTILNYLRILDNPLQDIPLYGTLISVFFGFTNEEIVRIRTGVKPVGDKKKKKLSLYECMKAYDREDSLKEKIMGFFETYESYRKLVSYTPVRQLITKIMDDAGYMNLMYALPGGAQRLANLEFLLVKASAFAQTGYRGLFGFTRYIRQLDTTKTDVETAAGPGGEEDAVRIMTIHKSKGLEFPVCIVASAGSSLKARSLGEDILIHNRFGIAVNPIDHKRRCKSKGFHMNYLEMLQRAENCAEEMRVLYVAMTRAMEKLIIIGSKKDGDGFLQKVYEKMQVSSSGPLREDEILGAENYLELMIRAKGRTPGDFKFRQYCGRSVKEERREHVPLICTPEEAVEDGEVKAYIDRLSQVYPYAGREQLVSKVTVSRLKLSAMEQSDIAGEAARKFESREREKYIPAFARTAQEPGGAARGDAYHHLCELIRFEDLKAEGPSVSDQDAEHLIRILVQDGRLSEQEEKLIDRRKIAAFLNTPLAARMSAAARKGLLKKEQAFVIGIPANMADPSYPADESVLLQGIIDAFFEENGEIVVMDYKTDAVKNEEELRARYDEQLRLYAMAIEKTRRKKVTGRSIYSFALGREIIL